MDHAESPLVPLTEDDLDQPGLIEPSQLVRPVEVVPQAVLCFFREVVEAVAARPGSRLVRELRSETGAHPVWEVDVGSGRVAVAHVPVGAPMAVGILEELIALGIRRFVAVGGAGALAPNLVMGHVVVVSSALRDEGTSMHYLAPSRTVEADPDGVAAAVAVLDAAGVEHVVGRSWTTDAFFRETRGRTDRRVAEGCVVVEMEAAAFFAVARYRGVRLAQIVYAGDSLAGESWESRDWTQAHTVREAVFDLAATIACEWQEAVSV